MISKEKYMEMRKNIKKDNSQKRVERSRLTGDDLTLATYETLTTFLPEKKQTPKNMKACAALTLKDRSYVYKMKLKNKLKNKLINKLKENSEDKI